MFKKLRNKVVAKLRHAKRTFFGNLHPHNPKEFWKVVKSLNRKQSIIPMLRNGDIIAASNLEKANLNTSLVKNFNHSLPRLTLSDLPHTSPDSCPTDFLCTEEEVYSLLSTLDTTKANGHDDISARMLKELYWTLQTSGLESWNRVMTSAPYFLTTVKLLIQFRTGLYCKSFKIMVYTNRSSDGLRIIFAYAHNMSV